jgi:lysophospholipase L1-like esterase
LRAYSDATVDRGGLTTGEHLMRPQLISTLAAATLVLAATIAPQAAQADDPVQYVAMGDSYGAGSGPYPLAKGSSPMCLQSAANYPHVVAKAIGAQLHDVTCGGATTAHFTKSQWPGVAPQAAALSAETDLVTVNIGGNDANAFGGAIVDCGGVGILSLGYGSPCKDRFGTKLNAAIDDVVYPNVVRALQLVHAKAPNAKVYFTGIPWVVPTTWDRTCYLKAPLARGDVPFIRAYEAHLNAVFKQASMDTGTTFVDMSVVSEGHDMCQAASVRWIEPVFGGTNVAHPNPRGMAAVAAQVLAAMTAEG